MSSKTNAIVDDTCFTAAHTAMLTFPVRELSYTVMFGIPNTFFYS